MRTIRLWFLAALTVALGLCAQASAQNSVHQNVALTPTGTPARFAKVLVCNFPANATPCTNLATIYADQTTSNPIANPLTTDQFGNYNFWAPQNFYSFQVEQNGQPAVYKSYVDILPNDPNNPIFSMVTLNAAITQNNQAATKLYVDTHGGGASLPHVTQLLGGDGGGGAVGLPEKGIKDTSGVGTVAWNEDKGLGLFDCRDTKYPGGGCLGTTPGLAMQALADDVTCYQSMTGLRANVIFPPGTIAIGTPTAPTLNFPTGAHYGSASPSPNGVATTFQATYNNHIALHFMIATTATCSDSQVHTNTLTSGYYGGGIGEHGCAQGGCVNVPGDTGGYPNGGPNQSGIFVEDSGGIVDLIGAYENGDTGISIAGESTHVHTVWTASNMAWYYFGHIQSGVIYNPATDGWHCNIVLASLDGSFPGPFETGGFLTTPGAEYGHVCGVYWGGGNTGMGSMFSNRDQIGLIRDFGNSNGGMTGHSRIDAALGEGILVGGGGNTLANVDNSSACSGFASVARGQIFGPYISNLGSGMTFGTYVVPAVNHAGDTTGSGATLTVTVSGGIATGIAVSNPGSNYLAIPTFTLTGTGGTPATIGAITYTHCDKLDEFAGGVNTYSNVKNIFESFFGTDHSTGDIWTSATSANSNFDRGTVGNFERVTGIINEPKGIGTHRDLPDLAFPGGGQTVTGPTPDFSQGNHFVSGDTTATSWTGATVGTIMQDIWIYGGNPFTTLPASVWNTCNGYDLNLAAPQWYHFFVFRDDVFFGPGGNFLFKEQCDTIDQNVWWVNHVANTASLPPLVQQATVDAMGDIRAHALPALPFLTGQFGGIADGVHGFAGTWFYAYRVWGVWGTQTSTLAGPINQCMPAAGFVNNPCFQTLIMSLPEGYTRYALYRESTTDTVATAGTVTDVSFTTPQHALSLGFADTYIAPLNATIIGTGKYGANLTGGIASDQCPTVPPTSSYPAIAGQVCIDYTGGFKYHADATDHWQRTAQTFANF